MKESATYQAAVREGLEQGVAIGLNAGAIKEVKHLLFRMTVKRLGEPPTRIRERIEGLSDLSLLEDLVERQATAGSWDELTAGL